MDILEKAMALEQQGEILYRSLAKDAFDEGAVYIFSRLADQERQHYSIFQSMEAGVQVLSEVNGDLKNVRDIFEGWRTQNMRLDVKPPQVELYRKALEVEEKSVRFYEENAKAARDDRARSVFLRIAGEEKRHRQLMENIIEFVTKPDMWAENAEFGYRGEDHYL